MQLTQSGLVNSSFSFLFIWLICVSVYTNFILLLFIFTRDTMHKCGLCCGPVSICTSVHPSVTLVDCINMAEDIIKLLSRPGSPITLVFWHPTPVPKSKGNPFSGGAKYKVIGNLEIFDWNHHLSRKQYEIGPWLLWNVNRKSYALHRLVTFSMTLMDS